ncbi:hypothetical protein QE197_18795 [Arsenophonus nasoniae]|uniref:Uncharacterized protein n=1 Tax=Arsenophonus nasoniae TaxID=638 RepID=D2U3G8_9GAMM|nr:hypothetical protein [Arsenophonus nasoniae]QBY41509.1 hypothetical protein ArsFIN_00270 [Arsenophonus nasoniae]WGM10741.1 hypothetical protein QE197_18795 [Arsenophonus nasoniae]WGM15448.1 hypothetical protein QE193_18685 [Arsenophonus nasoniae]CBA75875.1 hypothetical protein ARN_31880 [Arsenophonus nasoniae]
MKVASNAFKLNYISVDDKVSNKKELFEKNNNQEILNEVNSGVVNLDEKNVNTNNLSLIINQNISKEREIREASLPKFHNSIKIDKLINLIIKIILISKSI